MLLLDQCLFCLVAVGGGDGVVTLKNHSIFSC